jgi:type II secretory pathway pseudopilin PulG
VFALKRIARTVAIECGFSIVESLVASTIMIVGLMSVAQLFSLSTRANAAAETTTKTTILAREKMEQLRSLEWGFDSLGLPLSDIATDTSVVPESPTGGTGLRPSPPGTLSRSTVGYVDYLDGAGRSLGGGSAAAPSGTRYIRRWSVDPLASNPTGTLVLQVVVLPYQNKGTSESSAGAASQASEARLVTVRTRKAH